MCCIVKLVLAYNIIRSIVRNVVEFPTWIDISVIIYACCSEFMISTLQKRDSFRIPSNHINPTEYWRTLKDGKDG